MAEHWKRLGLVGYGEVGRIFASGLRPSVRQVAAWDIRFDQPEHRTVDVGDGSDIEDDRQLHPNGTAEHLAEPRHHRRIHLTRDAHDDALPDLTDREIRFGRFVAQTAIPL